jgi:hypothetical protein
MSSESVDVGADCWAIFHHTKCFKPIFPWAILEHDHSLNHWVAMEVDVHGLGTAGKVLRAIQVFDEESLHLRDNIFARLILLSILESCQKWSPEFTENLVEIEHFESLLTSLHGCSNISWVLFMRPELHALIACVIYSKVGDNC